MWSDIYVYVCSKWWLLLLGFLTRYFNCSISYNPTHIVIRQTIRELLCSKHGSCILSGTRNLRHSKHQDVLITFWWHTLFDRVSDILMCNQMRLNPVFVQVIITWVLISLLVSIFIVDTRSMYSSLSWGEFIASQS